jgi:heat shock protein HslJ
MQADSLDLNYWNYIAKHRWRLIQLRGELIHTPEIYLKFDINTMKISGILDDESLEGKFDSKGDAFKVNELSLSPITQSELNTNDQREKEREIKENFLQNLNSPNLKFDVADQTLNLYKDEELVIMLGRQQL